MVASSLEQLVAETGARKPPPHVKTYPVYFEALRDQPLKLLELGIDKGGSLEMWARYFPRAEVVGFDRKLPIDFSSDRIRTFQGSQDDGEALDRLSAAVAPEGWDIIIDDCSHQGAITLASFKALMPHLRVGGFYAIEDWATGYFPHWPDGSRFDSKAHFTTDDEGGLPSHRSGLVGFIKQIVDEVAMEAIQSVGDASRASLLEYAHVWRGIVMMRKAQHLPSLSATGQS